MNKKEIYQVGQLDHQKEDDETFADYDEAVNAAINGSWTDTVWAIWQLSDDLDDGEAEHSLEALVYQQTVFTPGI